MVQAEREIRQHQTDGLGKQMRDPATAFPPLRSKIFAVFGLVPDAHAPPKTNGIKHCQYCGAPTASENHQSPNIYIFIGRGRRILQVNSCKFENFCQRGWGSQPKSVWCQTNCMIGASY